MTNFGERGVEPYWEVADALPRAKMETVVKAFLTLIQDESKTGIQSWNVIPYLVILLYTTHKIKKLNI